MQWLISCIPVHRPQPALQYLARDPERSARLANNNPFTTPNYGLILENVGTLPANFVFWQAYKCTGRAHWTKCMRISGQRLGRLRARRIRVALNGLRRRLFGEPDRNCQFDISTVVATNRRLRVTSVTSVVDSARLSTNPGRHSSYDGKRQIYRRKGRVQSLEVLG